MADSRKTEDTRKTEDSAETTAEQKATTGSPEGGSGGKGKLRRTWYDAQNREVVIYYLIAVCFLELIVGAIAFFYGVTNAEPLVAGGPKMARFPWVGWLVAAILSPVGLLVLLHLSGQFFSRSLNADSGGGGQGGTGGGEGGEEVPVRLQRFYAIVRHAPTIVILLGLLAMGGAVLFVDSAMEMAMAVGGALRPYVLWIIGGVLAFFVICYLGRLFFLARHRRMEQEYAYRMKVLETTGIVIMNRNCIPMHYENGQLQMLDQDGNRTIKALPGHTDESEQGRPEDRPDDQPADRPEGAGAGAKDGADVEDATIIDRPK